jgi:hypothetical protein
MRVRKAASMIVLIVSGTLVLNSQETVDLSVVDRIKSEAFGRSQVMEHLRYLTDVHGPRLTASPQFDAAAKWAMDRLTGYGISNVHREPWGPFGRRWSIDEYSVEVVAPYYTRVSAIPLAWSRSTNGPLTGEPIVVPLGISFMRGPKKQAADLDAYRREWTGKLSGKIVMLTSSHTLATRDSALFKRYSDPALAELATAPEPVRSEQVKSVDDLAWPDKPEELLRFFMAMPEDMLDQLIDRYGDLARDRAKFFIDEGVAAVLVDDERAREGLLAAEAAGSFHARDPLAPPTFVLTAEHYGRIARMIEHKDPVLVKVDLRVTASDTDVDGANIVGEIPGGAKKDEIVMVGAHFDSWHSGTGATDNGAGSAVMIEVMRILKALNLRLDRTVRLGLWGGEEQGLLGSRAYVAAHFADPATMALKPEHAKLSGYFNLDNGSGKVRGVYLQQHEAMRPLFEQWLAPFRDLGVTTITIRNTGGTDHLSFVRVGLPGFQFVQDGLDYNTLTHHTSADTYDHAVPADLMQGSAVIASVVYDAANRADRLPRRDLPKAAATTTTRSR